MLGHVDQRLGDDEVRGGLDRGREPPVRHRGDRGGHQRALGQGLDRSAQPGLGQHRGMDPAGQLPQLGQRLPGLLAGRLDQRSQLRVRPGGAVAGHPQGQAQGHQPLLRAVMQVAFQPPSLGVPGLDDPRPGGTDLLQLGVYLGLQPGMLQRHAGRGRRQPDQLRLVLEPGVVHQHGAVRVGDRRHGAARIRPGHVDGLARGVQVAGPVRPPERQLQRRVTQRPGQRVPEPARRGARFQVDDRGAERTARRPGPHRADHEQGRARQQHQRQQGVRDQSGKAEQTPGQDLFCPDRRADPQQRNHGPPGPAARRPPVPDDQGQDDAGNHEPDERFDRVERIPGRSGTTADEQHVGRATSVAAAERGIPEHRRGRVERDVLHVVGDDHPALEPGPEPPGRPGQAQMGQGRAVDALGHVPDRPRHRVGQVDQDVRHQVEVTDDREQQAQPAGWPPLPGRYPGHHERQPDHRQADLDRRVLRVRGPGRPHEAARRGNRARDQGRPQPPVHYGSRNRRSAAPDS